MDSDYYKTVAHYYDFEADNFEERYWKNPILQRVRQSFREVVKQHEFTTVLEIGCGTGLDLAHFGAIFPDKEIDGIDVSPAMVAQAERKIAGQQLTNVRVKVGTPDLLDQVFPEVKYDHIYVFFGALNTVDDLAAISRALRGRLNPDGTMVLTFVNKWYLAEILIHLAKLRFGIAFRRLKSTWGGYSNERYLASRCISPIDVRRAFARDFEITACRGYSILYPAWFRAHWLQRLGKRACEALWSADQLLNRTPAWCLGEYALYSFKARN